MFFLLLYLMGATALWAWFPHWPTAQVLLVPLAVVGVLRLGLALLPSARKTPDGRQQDQG